MSIQTSVWDNGGCDINVENLTVNTIYSIKADDASNNSLIESIRKICDFHCIRSNLINVTDIKYCYNNSNRQSRVNNDTSDNLKLKLIFFVENVYNNCLICTDIDSDAYKYKQFNNQQYSLKIYRQKTGKHICIDPKVYTYSNTQNCIRSLDVYIYADKSTTKKNNDFILSENLPIQKFIGEKLNYSYYNDVLYNHVYNHDFIDNIIMECKCEYFAYEVLHMPEINQSEEIVKDELKSLIGINKMNRFLNRFVYNNAFDKITCNWIINGYLNKKHGNYISELNTFPMAYNYTIFALTNYILPFVNKCYSVDKLKYEFNIFETKIINVTNNFDVNILMNPNKDNFSINILLSDTDESSNEYFKFKDGTVNNIKQGDAIIFYTDLKCKTYCPKTPMYILNIQYEICLNNKEQRVL